VPYLVGARPQPPTRSVGRGRRGLLRRVPAWWSDVVLVGVAFWLYGVAQVHAPLHRPAAMDNGRWLLQAEGGLRLDVELAMNRWLASHPAVATVADYHYATVHFVAPAAVLLWLRLRHPSGYRPALHALVATCLLSLVVFWYVPVAPPRLLPGSGFVDTVLAFHTYGDAASKTESLAADQFASVPSLHVAWAAWCTWAVYPLLRTRWMRVLAVAHPLVTAVVVVATANHYVVDIALGVLALGAGVAVAAILEQVRARPPAVVDLRAHSPVPDAAVVPVASVSRGR